MFHFSGKLQLKKLRAAKETTTEMITLKSEEYSNSSKSIVEKKEELLVSYDKFHKRWMDELLNMKSRKPWWIDAGVLPDQTVDWLTDDNRVLFSRASLISNIQLSWTLLFYSGYRLSAESFLLRIVKRA